MMFLTPVWLLSHQQERPLDAAVDQKATQILSKMTLDEKIDMISGVDGFNERGVPRLGVPKLYFSDGPVGVRNFGPTTAYPAGVCLAATFNPELANDFGVGIGRDARARGVHVWLGPGVNLSRIPQNGRNFEYLGEDPYLASRTVTSIVRGVQSQGVVATVKHFAANNHEDDRNQDSSEVDERTLRELYLKPFEAAVKQGGAWAVMCGYNKLNGTYDAENPFLLTQVLKQDWGFKGIVMSDWGAVHSTLPTLKAGMDLEMPGGDFLNRETIKPLLDNGSVTLTDLDDKVYRILRMTYAMAFDQRPQKDESIPLDDPSNEKAALEVARQGTVLLKNRGHILPLDGHRLRHILVVGPNAEPAITGGGGSSYTTPAESVSLLAAIRKVAGPNVMVDYKPLSADLIDRAVEFKGFSLSDDSSKHLLKMERFNNQDLSGAPTETENVPQIRTVLRKNDGQVPTHFSVRWTGNVQFDHSGDYIATSRSDDGIRVFLDDKSVIDDWNDHGEKGDSTTIHVEKGRTYHLRVEYYQGEGDAIAEFGFVPTGDNWSKDFPLKEIRDADVVIASVGFNPSTEGEGQDRPFELPEDQSMLVKKIAELNPRTVVVNNSGAGVDMMPWVDRAAAIVQAWYPGGIGSQAIAEILFGVTNPSGKLPTTFPKTLKGTYYETAYPPINHKIYYKEGLFMGYRWFDAHHVDPLFPFGYGLSYTHFHLSDLKLVPEGDFARLTLKVRNTGDRPGAETVQAYVHQRDSKVVLPERELKGFAKVFLRPGEEKRVEVPVKLSDLAIYDVPSHRWILQSGKVEFLVGTSSRDLPLHLEGKVTGSR